MTAPLTAIATLNIPTNSFVAAIRFMKDNMMNKTEEEYEELYNQIACTSTCKYTAPIYKDVIEARTSLFYLVQNTLQASKKDPAFDMADVVTKTATDTAKYLIDYDFSINYEQRVTTSTEIVDGVEVVTHTPKAAKGGPKKADIVAGILTKTENLGKTKDALIALIMEALPGVTKSNANVYIYNHNKKG